MKTITEYQPLIFSALLSRGDHRRTSHRRMLRAVALALSLGYVMLGLKITMDTGLAVWDWQFWLIFAPLFFLGEQVLLLLARPRLHEVSSTRPHLGMPVVPWWAPRRRCRVAAAGRSHTGASLPEVRSSVP